MDNLGKKARAYADTALKAYGDVTAIELFVRDIVKAVEEAYIQGAKDSLQMPLPDKLSEEEAMAIKKMYKDAMEHYKWLGQQFAAGYLQAIERICGRDFVQT